MGEAGHKFALYPARVDWKDPETGQVDLIHRDVLIPLDRPWTYFMNAVTYHDLAHYKRRDWLRHENSALCWKRVTVSVSDDDFARGLELLPRLYGIDAQTAGPGIFDLTLKKTQWRVARSDAFQRIYGAAAADGRNGRATTSISIECSDLGIARAVLKTNGVDVIENPKSLIIPASQASGAVVELVPPA